jgi:hypothetical protein
MRLNEKRCEYVWPNRDSCENVPAHQVSVPRYMLNTDIPYPERVEVINAWLCDEHYEMIDSDKSWRHWGTHQIKPDIELLKKALEGGSDDPEGVRIFGEYLRQVRDAHWWDVVVTDENVENVESMFKTLDENDPLFKRLGDALHTWWLG